MNEGVSQQAGSDPEAPDQSAERSQPGASGSEGRSEASLARRERIEESYRKVPAIGDGWRWYDIPYRALIWLSTSWRWTLFPQRALNKFNYWVNWLSPFNEHERHKVRESSFDFTVPDDEHVRISTLWAVELFPPSEFASLERVIEKNEWDRRRKLLHGRESNSEMLLRSRAGSGWFWWRLAEIADVDGSFWSPDGTREKLPPEFHFIQLKAIQLGQGLTAVVARFWVADSAARKLDEVWHAPHEPRLVRAGGRPRAEDREWAAHRLAQEARCDLHEAARSWLRDRCPGFLGAAGESHRLLDLVLMDGFDPLSGTETPRELSQAFRALGLTEHGPLQRTSQDIPKLALVPARRSSEPGMTSHRTMGLWGQRGEVTAAATHLEMYGSPDDYAIASRYSDGIQNFLVTVAVSDFLEVVQTRYASLRDTARGAHRRFKPESLEALREQLLTLSLDLGSVHRDLEQYWSRRPHFDEEARFATDYLPHIRDRMVGDGHTPPEPEQLNDFLRERQKSGFDDLIDADRQYRDILSTAASIGVSLNTARTGRRALFVAGASLIVALVTGARRRIR
jgi:hypothetical protein